MLLQAENIVKTFPKKNSGLFKKESLIAVNHVSLEIKADTTIGLVGESGSGKSTLGEVLGDLQKPSSGVIYYKGRDIRQLKGADYQAFRRNVQFIFQNPQGSMNPYYKIKQVLLEPLKALSEHYDEAEALVKVEQMMEDVGLDASYLDRYPSELSGGQSQRVAIGRALLLNPEIIICDECVSALDVSVQAQILNLLKRMQKLYHTSYLFISHDIATVKYMSDEVIVMFRGDVVEHGTTAEVLDDPKNDYTKKLLKYVRLKNGE
ncbi:ABC transporter ATP-binding protein [Fundicoccus culcitae]|uniref:Dipeptide/oligopeptide/nickel ABC transporter ATP-binding protein n=1 Tax=Fundicoccus culcitae TaxID=2969821 RepID=A0ABY5P547_9LACT|nr:dipeptide/oligopeptide/nickel ABC transporter ATP-binding protein [Fundicoccus culcitae]UUX33605.1 dipeptide/oligopeptide/nickel ABC transporter ATP-binding protein [Fundicoccus culcitae]